MTPEEYANTNLINEITIIQNSYRKNNLPKLNDFEKAIIYKYTEDRFEELNKKLRVNKGINDTSFGELLYDSLNKIDIFIGNVYRGVNLTDKDRDRYELAFLNDMSIIEYSFISTSRSPLIGNQYGDIRFEIFTTTGRNVENVSKYPNEKEVIIPCNAKFRVIKIDINFIQLIEI